MTMLDNVQAVTFTDGVVGSLRRRDRRTPPGTACTPPEVTVVNPVALAHARRLAGGDDRRLRFGADGSVTVANGPR